MRFLALLVAFVLALVAAPVPAAEIELTPQRVSDHGWFFRLGGLTFRILFAEGAHSPEDVMLHVSGSKP